jgi:hypothetical protein
MDAVGIIGARDGKLTAHDASEGLILGYLALYIDKALNDSIWIQRVGSKARP